jgi:hypothetical protein
VPAAVLQRGVPPGIRLDGVHVVQDLVVPPVPVIWLPFGGQVVARIPGRDRRRWLQSSVRARSPRLGDDGSWELPRCCLTRLVTAAADRYGRAVAVRYMARLSRCSRACQQAAGADCDCSCLGQFHGQDSAAAWVELTGDVLVADLGERTRAVAVYVPASPATVGSPRLYEGELAGTVYRASPSGRKGWPRAQEFTCAACLTATAQVWDHCHFHRWVRGPLCGMCNTRNWRGWHPSRGLPLAGRNIDMSYYRYCPGYRAARGRDCSA